MRNYIGLGEGSTSFFLFIHAVPVLPDLAGDTKPVHQPSQVSVADSHLHSDSLLKYHRRAWGEKQKAESLTEAPGWRVGEEGEEGCRDRHCSVTLGTRQLSDVHAPRRASLLRPPAADWPRSFADLSGRGEDPQALSCISQPVYSHCRGAQVQGGPVSQSACSRGLH